MSVLAVAESQAFVATPAENTAARPVATDRFLDRPDGRIAYTDAGSGPLVVMVPGLGDLKDEYRFLAPRLLAAGYRVVTMDLRGHGRSTVGWPDYSSSAVGSDIVALLEHLKAGPATVIGTSMGAGATAWAAAESPDTIAQIVLIGPFVREIAPSSLTQRLMLAVAKVAFRGPWGIAVWGAYYASLYPTAKPADLDPYIARLKANLGEPGRLAALNAMLVARKDDVGRRLHEIRARTLVLMGSKDPDFPDPVVEAETVARLTRGASVMIEGAGHYPQAEMPDVTASAIVAFLAGAKN